MEKDQVVPKIGLKDFESRLAKASVPNSLEEVAEAVNELMKESILSVVLEGNKEGRSGTLLSIQFSSHSKDYLFNIKDLGLKVFELYINQIFENKSTIKLFWDCRNDIETLHHICKANTQNYYDVQLAYLLKNEELPNLENQGKNGKFIYLPGLQSSCVELKIFEEDLIEIRESVRGKFKKQNTLNLNEIPDMIYALSGTYAILCIYNSLMGTDDSLYKELGDYSLKYAKILWEKEVRSYDIYEWNSILPLGVFGNYIPNLICFACERKLNSKKHFSQNQKKNKIKPKCKVCSQLHHKRLNPKKNDSFEFYGDDGFDSDGHWKGSDDGDRF